MAINNALREPSKGRGWLAVASVFSITFLSFGTAYSIGIIFDMLMAEFECSKSEVSIFASIAFSMQCFLGPFSSYLLRKFEARTVILLGCCLISTSFVCSSFAPNIVTLYFTFGLIGGIGMGLAYLPVVVIISFYFRAHRTLATALGCLGSYVGCFVHPYVMRIFMEHYGWRGTLLLIGGLGLNSVAASLLLPPISCRESQADGSHEIATNVTTPVIVITGPPDEITDASPSLWDTGITIGQPLLEDDIVTELQRLSRAKHCDNKTPVNSPVNGRPRSFLKSRQQISAPALDKYFLSKFDAKMPLQHSISMQDYCPHSCEINSPEFRLMSHPLWQPAFSHLSSLSGMYSSSIGSVCPPLNPPPSISDLCTIPPWPLNNNGPLTASLLPPGGGTATITADRPRRPSFIMGPIVHFRNPRFSFFCVTAFLVGLAFYTPSMYVVNWGLQLGFTPQETALLLSLVGLGNIFGRPIVALTGDVLPNSRLLLYLTLVSTSGIVMLAAPWFANFYVLAFCVFQFAFLIGGSQTLLTPILADMVSSLAELPDAFGALIVAQGAALLIGPPLLGLLPSYELTFSISGLSMLLGAIVFTAANHCQKL